MPVAVGKFMSTVEHFALLLDAKGWSHITTIHVLHQTPIREMYAEQPGDEKNVRNVNVHVLNTPAASD